MALARSAGLGEQQGHQAEGGRCGKGLTRTLQEPAGDQHPGTDRGTAQDRGHSEERDPDQEHALAAQQVGQAPAEKQQPAGGQDVAVHHPGQAGPAEVEAGLDVGQGVVHHGDVEHQDELDQGDYGQSRPPPAVRNGSQQSASVTRARARYRCVGDQVQVVWTVE